MLFAEACGYLAIARLAVAFLPFRFIARWMSLPAVGRQSQTRSAAIATAIDRAARRTPWRSVCIHQGIAAQRMLRRRGYGSVFVYGLAIPDADLKAHVWVTLDGETLVGGHASNGFARVAVFPPPATRASLDLSGQAG